MSELPLHVALDHLLKIRGRDRFILVRPPFRLVKCFARNFDAETSIKRGESVLPMEAVAIQGAAHIEKNRANHKPARNLRSAWRCQTQRAINARFIGKRTKMKNRSTRCSHINIPRA